MGHVLLGHRVRGGRSDDVVFNQEGGYIRDTSKHLLRRGDLGGVKWSSAAAKRFAFAWVDYQRRVSRHSANENWIGLLLGHIGAVIGLVLGVLPIVYWHPSYYPRLLVIVPLVILAVVGYWLGVPIDSSLAAGRTPVPDRY